VILISGVPLKIMKGSADFRFKQFTIKQSRSTHKVGTDGVLLGAWSDIQGADRILDIGTGTGLIALMLAQRTPQTVLIDAVEIDKDDAQQARENVQNSPWPSKINVLHNPVQEFNPDYRYDLIVTNPPYFINSWLPPEKKRGQARHTQELSFEDLLLSVKRLLKKSGKLSIILPLQEGMQFIQQAHFHQLYCIRQLAFRSRSQKPVERLLLEFGENPQSIQKEELILHGDRDTWSEEYQDLTRNFYLKI
jgi:tRNA1Val (adenine37-N6)-methyltransferase